MHLWTEVIKMAVSQDNLYKKIYLKYQKIDQISITHEGSNVCL